MNTIILRYKIRGISFQQPCLNNEDSIIEAKYQLSTQGAIDIETDKGLPYYTHPAFVLADNIDDPLEDVMAPNPCTGMRYSVGEGSRTDWWTNSREDALNFKKAGWLVFVYGPRKGPFGLPE